MKENLIKKERNAKETVALVTGMFANIQDSLKDDRVRYRIFEDSYDAKKVLYFQMLEKSEFVNYKVVEIQDKDIVTFKLFLQTYGDDKLICEHTITDRYRLSIKHQTDINISKETDIKSKEDKKEYPEHILKLLEMFKEIDRYFKLKYFAENKVYPLLEKSVGEFLNLCNKVWRQHAPIYPAQAVKIDPDKIKLLSDFYRLVSVALIEDEALTKRYDNLIYNVKEVMKIFKYQHDINTETYINYLSHADLIDFSTEVLYNLIDMNTKIEGKTKEKYLLDLGISIAGLVIVELKRKYSSIQNIDQTYKDAKTEQAAIKILKNAIINFENKVKTSLFDKQVIQQDSYSNLISFDKQELLQQDSYLNLISSAISLYDHICSKQTPLSILNYAYFSYDDLDTIADFSRLIDTCISSVEYIYTTTDEKDAAKTLGRKFDSITKFFEFDNYDDPGYPEDGDDKKIIKFLLNQATTLNPLLSNYIESCKEDGIDTDSCSIMSVILEDFSSYTFKIGRINAWAIAENKQDIKMNGEKDIFAPTDWEKEFEKSSKELLKRAYCCKELNPTSLYPSYVTVTERPNWHDEHLSILQPLDAKKSATKVIAHIVAHMSNAPISKDTIVESFVDQFCNINVNIYDNSGESPKTLVTRTYAHDEYTVTELGCGYAVGIYSTKYNKNESKDYYIPYKKKC
jgi:hypothetical protein